MTPGEVSRVLKNGGQAEIASYDLVETDTELYITERVNNIMLFRKGEVNERHKKISDTGRDNIEINSHDQYGV